MNRFYLNKSLLASVYVSVSLSGCIRDIELPNVGECANYPNGVYDYGEINIGKCIGAPIELQKYEGTNGSSLLIVNSNQYLNFADGSVLSLDMDQLEKELDLIVEEKELLHADNDIDPYPETIIVTDEQLKATSVSIPSYSGKLAVDKEKATAFVSNRLSVTTHTSINDYIYGIDLSKLNSSTGENSLDFLDISDGLPPISKNKIEVEHDPFGLDIVYNESEKYLLVVNETSHTVSLVDITKYPFYKVNSDRVGVVSDPFFSDQEPFSFSSLSNIAVSNAVASDTWYLKYTDGLYRTWYTSSKDGSLRIADSADGLLYKNLTDSTVLAKGNAEEKAWDSEGIKQISITGSSSGYIVYYEGQGILNRDDTTEIVSRIGLAYTTDNLATSIEKYDLYSDLDPSNDYVLDIGLENDFDSKGVSAPSILESIDSGYSLLFTGINSEGKKSLGQAFSTDGINWEDRKAMSFTNKDYAGDEQMDTAGFYDYISESYKIWFVQKQDGKTCISLAESLDLETFDIYVSKNKTPCLQLESKGQVFDPSIVKSGDIYWLWYASSENEQAKDITIFMAYSFDGINWENRGTAGFQNSPSQNEIENNFESYSGGLFAKLLSNDNWKLERTAVGTIADGIPSNENLSVLNGSLIFTISDGYVLGKTHNGVSYSSSDVSSPPWDSGQIYEPAFDSSSQGLYYSGKSDHSNKKIGFADRLRKYRWKNAQNPLESDDNSIDETSPDIVSIETDNGLKKYLYYTEVTDDSKKSIQLKLWNEESQLWLKIDTENGWNFPAEENELTSDPSVVPPDKEDNYWHMWFTSNINGSTAIAHSWSKDGIYWERKNNGGSFEDSIALYPELGGNWDDLYVKAPSVLKTSNGDYLMYYEGFDGSISQIGLAQSSSIPIKDDEQSRIWQWTRYEDTNSYTSYSLLYPDASWDRDGVSNPEIYYDESSELYYLWYEAIAESNHNIALATSIDGIIWNKSYEPLSTGDTFSFQTYGVKNYEYETLASTLKGTIPLEFQINGYPMSGNGATEISVSPKKDIAVVTSRFSAGLYIIDTRDDSTGTTMDLNYHSIEGVVPIPVNASGGQHGTRSVKFDPLGERIYATSSYPPSVLVFNRNFITDEPFARLLSENVFMGAISLDIGLSEDEGERSSSDVGPIGLEFSKDGQYLFVANGNANSVYIIDLKQGELGKIVSVARNVGEMPVALTLSSNGKYLFVANEVGEIETTTDGRFISHSTIAIIDVNPESIFFGKIIANIKNR